MSRRLSDFESIKHLNQNGEEYWFASELAILLDYKTELAFKAVLQKAIAACKLAGYSVQNHFRQMLELPSPSVNDSQATEEYVLSRLGCYLCIQNSDPSSNPVVSLAQAYFAIQTRHHELSDVAEAVSDFAIFQDHGYMGLYGGLKARDIHARKELKQGQKILDYMGSTELAANLFRTTQAEEQIRRENIKERGRANQAHYRVGQKVRQTIEELGGTMPEDLPTPRKSVQQLQREEQKRLQQEPQTPLFPSEE